MGQVLEESYLSVHFPTTVKEGLCMANLEAMAIGRPTIVSDDPGLKDAVIDGVTGFVVPRGDFISLADRIVFLLQHKQRYTMLSKNARNLIKERFNIDQTVSEWEKLFADTLDRHGSGKDPLFKKAYAENTSVP